MLIDWIGGLPHKKELIVHSKNMRVRCRAEPTTTIALITGCGVKLTSKYLSSQPKVSAVLHLGWKSIIFVEDGI